MSDEALIVDYDPFIMESKIYKCKDNYQEKIESCSTIEDLTKNIIALSYENDIYDVFVRAPFDIMSEIRRIINDNEYNLYSKNKIKVGSLA